MLDRPFLDHLAESNSFHPEKISCINYGHTLYPDIYPQDLTTGTPGPQSSRSTPTAFLHFPYLWRIP